MALTVMKFGGAALSDTEHMKGAADLIKKEHLSGNSVVAVLSARGDTTDILSDMGSEVSKNPDKRENDVLLAAGEQISVALCAIMLKDDGFDAVSAVGRQIGIITDDTYADAEIIAFSGGRIKDELEKGRIVIAAGFQGVTENGDITTLGRGGSDTTAVFLAYVLGAAEVRMYKDVDGIYTVDPKKDPSAEKLDSISYDDMLKLIDGGSGVLHKKCVLMAKDYGIKIRVMPFGKEGGGTVVG